VNWKPHALGLLLCVSATGAAADPVERGATVHQERGCNACHGQEGVSTVPDQFPHLAGQHASYLEHALKGYRDGTRSNAVMNPMAAALSDDDIRVLAAFYAAQEGLITAPRDRVIPRQSR
jgi:cytochrome c553